MKHFNSDSKYDNPIYSDLTYAQYKNNPNDLPGFFTILFSAFMPLYGFTLGYIWRKDKPHSSNIILCWSAFCMLLFAIFTIIITNINKILGNIN